MFALPIALKSVQALGLEGLIHKPLGTLSLWSTVTSSSVETQISLLVPCTGSHGAPSGAAVPHTALCSRCKLWKSLLQAKLEMFTEQMNSRTLPPRPA